MSRARRRIAGAACFAVALAVSSLGMGRSPAQDPAPNPAADHSPVPSAASVPVPWIDTRNRGAVIEAHQAAFAIEVPPIGWTGSHDGCQPGTSNQALRAATVVRVNYYRAMAGVSATVVEEPAFSAKAQQAALMMSAEGALTHEPTSAYACYTPVGREGAANSNLYLGRNGPSAIDGYIEDPGPENVDVGHRNVILHPPTRAMGVGDVEQMGAGFSANALWVFDDRVFDEGVPGRRAPMREPGRFVAWPPRGYVPAELVHPRWSFTLAGADLSAAEVAMYDISADAGSAPVPLEVVNRSGAPGHVPLPTIVWEPRIGPPGATDRHYLVMVSGVVPEVPILASADPANDPANDPAGARVVPGYAYVVRVLGARPSGQLDPDQVLARISVASRPDPVGGP